MSPSETEIETIWRETWAQLVRATRDRRHGFRNPVIATRCPRRGVRARTVVLRDVDAKRARLTLHTDARSGKVEALRSAPVVSWCFYDGRRRLQVRAETRASMHRGDDVARVAWDRQGPAARALYAVEPAPATPLAPGASPSPREGDGAGFEHFVVVVCDVEELDWLHLGRDGHRRIRFAPQGPSWPGSWIVP